MHIYIVRHAEAGERDEVAWPDDRLRPLTKRGEKRWRRAARGLGRIMDDIDVVLSSPLVRTWGTATILEEEADWPAPIECEALAPGHKPEEVLSLLKGYDRSITVALVGHEPDLHMLTSYLLTGDASLVEISLEKGACICLTMPDGLPAGEAELHWILTPKALRALRH